TRTQT
ncbi:hypothetical protein D046_6530B, partial [Vibrio parahaemolyticus V-223/04]